MEGHLSAGILTEFLLTFRRLRFFEQVILDCLLTNYESASLVRRSIEAMDVLCHVSTQATDLVHRSLMLTID